MSEYSINYKVENWIVKREHIERLIALFKKRFPNSEVETKVHLKFRNGTDTKEFKNFISMDSYLKKEVLGLKRTLEKITISCAQISKKTYKQAWIDIEFRFSQAIFFIIGKGDDKIKDWTDGFYDEVEVLFNSFKPAGDSIEFIKRNNTQQYKYKTSLIFFDYDGQIEKSLAEEKNTETLTSVKNWWENNFVQIIIFLAAIIAIYSFIFRK